MSKRLQVILDDAEMREIRRTARQQRLTVAEWVRQALRKARRDEPKGDISRKIESIRKASAQYRFPAGDINQMIEEIERGYRDEDTE
jgi:hypothetical protein